MNWYWYWTILVHRNETAVRFRKIRGISQRSAARSAASKDGQSNDLALPEHLDAPCPDMEVSIVMPRCSMYGIFTYICPKNDPNVGKYSIHGAFGMGVPLVIIHWKRYNMFPEKKQQLYLGIALWWIYPLFCFMIFALPSQSHHFWGGNLLWWCCGNPQEISPEWCASIPYESWEKSVIQYEEPSLDHLTSNVSHHFDPRLLHLPHVFSGCLVATHHGSMETIQI